MKEYNSFYDEDWWLFKSHAWKTILHVQYTWNFANLSIINSGFMYMNNILILTGWVMLERGLGHLVYKVTGRLLVANIIGIIEGLP